MSTLTLKVPAETTRWLEEEARKTSRSKSAIVRDAIARLRGDTAGGSALDAAGDAVGSVKSGRRDLGSDKRHLRGFGAKKPRAARRTTP